MSQLRSEIAFVHPIGKPIHGTPKAAQKHERNCTMPNPKRRHSTRRTANRRAHDFLTASGISECPNCHEKKLPHVRCPKCKQYKGRLYGEPASEK
jgi:large subunit ribosomal protein L32